MRGGSMSKYLNDGFLASVALVMIGLYLVLLCSISPYLAAAGIIDNGMVLRMLVDFPFLALICGLLSMIALLLSGMADAVFSRRELAWKAKWVLLIAVFGLIGLVFYYISGTKERDAKVKRR